MLAAVFSSLSAEAALVASTRRAMVSGAPTLAAAVAAVLLPMVVGATDEEIHDAPGARQHVNGNDRVQGSGATARNLDVGQNRGTTTFVERPALGLRPKARAADSGLHSFRCAQIILQPPTAGHFSTLLPCGTADPSCGRQLGALLALVPWSPAILVEMVPILAGGDMRIGSSCLCSCSHSVVIPAM